MGHAPGKDHTFIPTLIHDVEHVGSALLHPSQLLGALRELEIDAVVISDILNILGDGERDLPEQVRGVGAGSFGNLPTCGELSRQTELTREYLRGVIVEMLATLGLYVDGVRAFRDGTSTADSYTAEQFHRIRRSVDATASAADGGYHPYVPKKAGH